MLSDHSFRAPYGYASGCGERDEINPSILEYVPDKFKTEEFCLKCVRLNALNLKGVPEQLKTYELCYEAVSDNGYALELVPPHLITKEMVLKALRYAEALKYVPETIRDEEVYFEVIKNATSGLCFDNIPEKYHTKENFLAVLSNPQAHCKSVWDRIDKSFKTNELLLEAVKLNGRILEILPDEIKTYELCLGAVKMYGPMLEFTPSQFRTKELCLAALAGYSRLEFVPDELKTTDFFLSAFKENAFFIKYIPIERLSYEMCRDAVERYNDAILYIPEQFRTEELWRIALTNHGYCWLKELPPALMSEELCRLAVNSYGRSIQYVPEQFRTKELFFDAVKEDGKALKHIDINKLTAEEYTEICKAALDRARPY
jgi:hypothetical protein